MDHQDIAVAKTTELMDGEMKQVSAEGQEILLARVRGNFYAVGAHCTHYGAPLVEGVLSGERIVCPWHHACFGITTGDLEEPPAFDSLTRYEVRIEDDHVVVRVPKDAPDRRTPQLAKRDAKDQRLFVIAGGGAAGYAAAQTLREEGFAGRIVMITREQHLPYDRPNLSKDYLQGNAEPGWLPLRPDEFFAEHDIEVLAGKEIKHIDAAKKTITFADGETLFCDALLVATGGEPRKLPFQNEHQENVFLLRSHDDSDAIIAAAEKGKRAVVIGASFIGMEAASSLRARGCEVTVVAPDDVPFQKILGPEISRLFQDIHEENGVRFKLGASVAAFDGAERVTAVVLENGERLDADLVVVGVGVKPATEMLEGVTLHHDGGVMVDAHMRAADGVFAAGDIAYFPHQLTGERQRIEHWRTAMQQGRIAAKNMAGNEVAYDGVPFFWTRQFDAGLLYVGHAASWEEIVYQGYIPARDFLAFYIKDGEVVAVAGMNRDREMAAAEELMRLGRMPTVVQLKLDVISLVEALHNTSGRIEVMEANKESHDKRASLEPVCSR
ncbi:MAG TPA: FAD-dependent oxidoreductase [Pyrinomonadaceae bacterium]|nr:FAD-dependent oxidoreductase [Pyrinomonadaceae bacterium]